MSGFDIPTPDPEAAAGVSQEDVDAAIAAAVADFPTSTDITDIVVVTQAAYDALTPPVATTLYVIVG